MDIPVYVINGFLDSGKTTFLKTVLRSEDFMDGERTLLILCEEGEEEYDAENLAKEQVMIATIDDEEDLTDETLNQLQQQYNPERIVIEYNGMWQSDTLFDLDFPDGWEIAQTITIVDATTFALYQANMKGFMSSLFQYAQLVIFNRADLSMDLQSFRRTVKALNGRAMIVFEDEKGEEIALGKEQPPYDLTADIIEIADEDYGLWFLDAMENPERYKDKLIKFKGKVMKNEEFPTGFFIPGRNAMTCCEDDIRFVGYLCRTKYLDQLKQKQWIYVTAMVKYEYREEYGEKGPVLYSKKIESAKAPESDLVYFN